MLLLCNFLTDVHIGKKRLITLFVENPFFFLLRFVWWGLGKMDMYLNERAPGNYLQNYPTLQLFQIEVKIIIGSS